MGTNLLKERRAASITTNALCNLFTSNNLKKSNKINKKGKEIVKRYSWSINGCKIKIQSSNLLEILS